MTIQTAEIIERDSLKYLLDYFHAIMSIPQRISVHNFVSFIVNPSSDLMLCPGLDDTVHDYI